MGSETLLLLLAVGTVAGWVLLGFAHEEDRLDRDDDDHPASGRRAANAQTEHHLCGLAALGLTREACEWIHQAMAQDRRVEIEDRAVL